MARQAATLAAVSSEAIARELWDAWERGDLAGMFELIDPQIVSRQFPEQIDVRDYHGHDGVREVMEDWIGTWEDWKIELLDVREVGDGAVLSLRQSGRGKSSGAAMDQPVWFVWGVRDGKVTRWLMFSSEAEALAAAAGA
jgi:ketosteroid isomerase-like protein